MTDHPASGRPAATGGATDPTDVTSGITGTEITDAAPAGPGDLYEAEVLVEEISIDGMCGVY
jgi:mycofactocin precursor